MTAIDDLLARLWDDYAALNPRVRAIRQLLEQQGETVVNDHIALRSFDDPRVGIDRLAAAFTAHGYEPRDAYTFTEKKLTARHYQHPRGDLPKVFISQLDLAQCSAGLRRMITRLIDHMPADLPGRPDFPVAGRPWPIDFQTYEVLAGESEYAAWVAAFGFRANHFTVFVNALKKYGTLEAINDLIKQSGYELNASGGEIKGSPDLLLEQSSTLADQVAVEFDDGPHVVPACYYEFARRYPQPDGRLFQGFVAKSADKIFESTHRQT